MTEDTGNSKGQPAWLIVAVIIISASSLLCCSCLAVAWFAGDVVVDFFNEFSSFFQFLAV